MNKPFVGGIVAAIAVLVGGGVFLLAPLLESSETKTLARTGEATERARRLLYRFNQNQERIGALLEALNRSGVRADIDVPALLEKEKNREIVKQVDHRLGANVPQMTRSLSKGLEERKRLAAENKALLQQALDAVNEGLAESAGDADGGENVRANRLKGIILNCLAQSRHQEADLLRQEAARFRSKLAVLGRRAQCLVNQKELVASSQIDRHIATAERDVSEAETLLAGPQAQADAVRDNVDELKSRIADTRAEADTARARMENMQADGLDLADSKGFEKFAHEYDQVALTYRQAVSELHRLESGTLLNARIDRSGDLIKGEFVPVESEKPIGIDRGLAGLENDLSEVLLKVENAERAVESARAFRDALVAQEAEYRRRSTQAAADLQEMTNAISNSYTEFSRLSEKAEQVESTAINHYRQSANAFASAARLAGQRSSDADAAIAELSPEARERSPENKIAEDKWLEQQYRVNAADAQINLGRLYYTISEEAKRTVEVLSAMPDAIVLPGLDLTVWQKKRKDAQEDGKTVLTSAYDSLRRTRGRLRGNWTVAAEAAAAADLLDMLGEENLRNIAIETYRQVVKGHNEEAHMQPYVRRLEILSGR